MFGCLEGKGTQRLTMPRAADSELAPKVIKTNDGVPCYGLQQFTKYAVFVAVLIRVSIGWFIADFFNPSSGRAYSASEPMHCLILIVNHRFQLLIIKTPRIAIDPMHPWWFDLIASFS